MIHKLCLHTGGELRFVTPPLSRPDIYCEGLPWLVEARENRSLFVLTWGWLLPLEPSSSVDSSDINKCPTSNRVLLYTGWPPRLHKIVCPADPGAREYTVHVFSEEWLGSDEDRWPGPPRPPALLFDFVSREPGHAAASWLEISKSRSALRSQLRLLPERDVNGTAAHADCPHKCPELGACIAASLWCDGRVNCPSGYDEANCGSGARLLGLLPSAMWLMVAAIIGIATAFACLLVILISRYVKTKDAFVFYHSRDLPNENMFFFSFKNIKERFQLIENCSCEEKGRREVLLPRFRYFRIGRKET